MIYDVTDLEVYKRASVPSNITEGFAKRRSAKEFLRFLEISMGSSDEVITRVRSAKIMAIREPRIDKALCDKIIAEYKIISKQLNRLSRNWVDYTKPFSKF